MTNWRTLKLPIGRERDVVLARQRARQLSDALGFESQDQTRIATAVSEIARNAHEYGGGGSIEFALAGGPERQVLEIRVSDSGPGIPNLDQVLHAQHKSATGMGVGLRGAGRLMDRLDVDSSPGQGATVTLSKVLPTRAKSIQPSEWGSVVDGLTSSDEEDLLQEVRRQNQELVVSLDRVRSQQEKLQELNLELEETNRGVIALHAELEEKSERLRRTDEHKSSFLSNMSHEIRTPLNGIIGYTERLMDEDLTPDQRRTAERIQAAGALLLRIVDDILDFSKIEAGRIELEEHPFSIDALIDNTVSIISGIAEEKGLSVRLDLDANLPKALIGDEIRLRQVLLNLLTNAVKFTHRGHISLCIRSEGRTEHREILRLSVTDTGIGIPADRRDQLFKRFSQADATVQRVHGGTGLGLAISKRLIELMGGDIGLESEEGCGSTFWITVALPSAKHADIPSFQESAPEAAASARILVAEDLEFNQDLARAILEKAGHRVDVVVDGAEAVAAARARAYDLVLMDIQMPVMDGIQAAREIRGLDAPKRDVPIVAMTANVLPQQIRSFKQAGIDDHIGKPMKRADLLKKVGEWLPTRCVSDDVPMDAEASADPAFHRSIFNQLETLVGRDRIADWTRNLNEQLHTAFDETSLGSMDRAELGRMSHAIVSQAGSLGFVQLEKCCRTLEQACLGGGDLSTPYQEARSAAQRAREILANLPGAPEG